MHNKDYYKSSENYVQDWIINKIINIPVQDILRTPWEYKNLDQKQQEIYKRFLNKKKFRHFLEKALRTERLYGGCVLLPLVKSVEGESYTSPLNLKNISENDLLKYIAVSSKSFIKDSSFIEKEIEESNIINGMKQIYNKYEYYSYNSVVFNETRILLFKGNVLDDSVHMESLTGYYNNGFGLPVIEPIIKDIQYYRNIKEQISKLLKKTGSYILALKDTGAIIASSDGKEKIDRYKDLIKKLENDVMVVQGDSETELQSFPVNFSNLPDIMTKALQDVLAGSDIPESRFLGTTPSGLNASGKADLENYYNSIDYYRNYKLKPLLEENNNIAMRACFGKSFKEEMIEIEMQSSWSLTDLEKEQINQIKVNNLLASSASGMFSDSEIREEFNKLNIINTSK